MVDTLARMRWNRVNPDGTAQAGACFYCVPLHRTLPDTKTKKRKVVVAELNASEKKQQDWNKNRQLALARIGQGGTLRGFGEPSQVVTSSDRHVQRTKAAPKELGS